LHTLSDFFNIKSIITLIATPLTHLRLWNPSLDEISLTEGLLLLLGEEEEEFGLLVLLEQG
jgi:hypothetical protein